MKKKTRKTGKRAVARKSTQQHGPAKKKSGGARKPAAARKPETAKTSGSGLVYTDLLREALARRRG